MKRLILYILVIILALNYVSAEKNIFGYEVCSGGYGNYVLCDDFEDGIFNTSLFMPWGSPSYLEANGYLMMNSTGSVSDRIDTVNSYDFSNSNYSMEMKFEVAECDNVREFWYAHLDSDRTYPGDVAHPSAGSEDTFYLYGSKSSIAVKRYVNYTFFSHNKGSNSLTLVYENDTFVGNFSTTFPLGNYYWNWFPYCPSKADVRLHYFMMWEGDMDSFPYIIPSNWTSSDLTGADWIFTVMRASDGNLYAGTAQNGGVYKSTDEGSSWTKTGALSGATQVHTLIDVDGALFAGTYPSANIFKSIDYGITWSNITSLPYSGDVTVLLESNGSIIAGTSGSAIFKSNDNGNTWINVVNLSNVSYMYRIVKSNGNLYVSTGDYGKVYKSEDNGDSWTATAELPGVYRASRMIAASDGSIYVGVSFNPGSGIFNSIDQGDSWRNIVNFSLDSGVRALIQTKSNTIYAATASNDVFATLNKGDNWRIVESPPSYVLNFFEGSIYGGAGNQGRVYIAKDTDGDNYLSLVDCDDSNPNINPSSIEICSDSIDNNCNGYIDEEDSDCPYTYILNEGWNLFGYVNPTMSVGKALEPIEGCYENVLGKFDLWNSYNPTKPVNNLKNLTYGRGYWIKINCSEVELTI